MVNKSQFYSQKSDAIVEMIDRFMALSNDERKTMGLAGRYKMEKEFNRDIVDAAYLKVISEIKESKQ